MNLKRHGKRKFSELGTHYVGTAQPVRCTCKLHDIDPRMYLVDVLQRLERVSPSKDVNLSSLKSYPSYLMWLFSNSEKRIRHNYIII